MSNHVEVGLEQNQCGHPCLDHPCLPPSHATLLLVKPRKCLLCKFSFLIFLLLFFSDQKLSVEHFPLNFEPNCYTCYIPCHIPMENLMIIIPFMFPCFIHGISFPCSTLICAGDSDAGPSWFRHHRGRKWRRETPKLAGVIGKMMRIPWTNHKVMEHEIPLVRISVEHWEHWNTWVIEYEIPLEHDNPIMMISVENVGTWYKVMRYQPWWEAWMSSRETQLVTQLVDFMSCEGDTLRIWDPKSHDGHFSLWKGHV